MMIRMMMSYQKYLFLVSLFVFKYPFTSLTINTFYSLKLSIGFSILTQNKVYLVVYLSVQGVKRESFNLQKIKKFFLTGRENEKTTSLHIRHYKVPKGYKTIKGSQTEKGSPVPAKFALRRQSKQSRLIQICFIFVLQVWFSNRRMQGKRRASEFRERHFITEKPKDCSDQRTLELHTPPLSVGLGRSRIIFPPGYV